MSSFMENFNPLSMLLRDAQRADEDAIDRLSRKASTLIFCALAICVTVMQLTGEVIKCWTPSEFTSAQLDYVKSYCWTANTHHLSMVDDVLAAPRKIFYYQWVPIALLVQAAGFYTPSIVWSVFKGGLAANVKRAVAMFERSESLNPSVLDDSANVIAKDFDRSLRYGRQQSQQLPGRSASGCGGFGVRCGSSAVIGYLLSKALYLLNATGQLIVLKFFLGTNYSLYGIDVLRHLAAEGTYYESPRFPRVILCHFTTMGMRGTLSHYTIQCTLPINLFNQKMYVFVWFWLVAVAVATGLGLVLSLCELLYVRRVSFVSRYLRCENTGIDGETEDASGGREGRERRRVRKDEERQLVREFCREYLSNDGHFALRLISNNTSDAATSRLMHKLWNLFKQRRAARKDEGQQAAGA